MKKQSIFTIVALVAIFVMSSCNKYEAKEVKLSTQNDSLNYTLGLANGYGIKNYYMQKDSTDKAVIALLKAIDEAYKADVSQDEMYKLGLQIGASFKQQKKQGLMGDSTLVFDEKLVKQGLVNALNGFKEGQTPAEAEEYIRKVMTELQAKKMGQQMPQQGMPEQAPQMEQQAPQQ
jgi:hypothetical protein